jgi:protein phosphatase
MITQALGCPSPIRAVLSRVALRRGDRLLICSDGLHGEVPDERLGEYLAMGLSPSRTLEALAEEALARGGRDNLTGLLLALDDPGLPLPTPGEAVRIEHPPEPVEAPESTELPLPAPAASSPTHVLNRLGSLLRGKP